MCHGAKPRPWASSERGSTAFERCHRLINTAVSAPALGPIPASPVGRVTARPRWTYALSLWSAASACRSRQSAILNRSRPTLGSSWVRNRRATFRLGPEAPAILSLRDPGAPPDRLKKPPLIATRALIARCPRPQGTESLHAVGPGEAGVSFRGIDAVDPAHAVDIASAGADGTDLPLDGDAAAQ